MIWSRIFQDNPAGLMTYAQAFAFQQRTNYRSKVYIVYVLGEEQGYITASGINAAEKKARAMFPSYEGYQVSVEPTEI